MFALSHINLLNKLSILLQRVIKELESQSGPGGLHENTMLIVMGDHGQTLNGDHGGGGSEEVCYTVAVHTFGYMSALLSFILSVI